MFHLEREERRDPLRERDREPLRERPDLCDVVDLLLQLRNYKLISAIHLNFIFTQTLNEISSSHFQTLNAIHCEIVLTEPTCS